MNFLSSFSCRWSNDIVKEHKTKENIKWFVGAVKEHCGFNNTRMFGKARIEIMVGIMSRCILQFGGDFLIY